MSITRISAAAAGHAKEQEPPHVGVYSPPLSDRGDQCGQLVVGEHQVDSLTRHLGAVLAHGNPYIRSTQGRSVVYAVADHRDRLPGVLPGRHNGDLLLRSGPRDYRGSTERFVRRAPGVDDLCRFVGQTNLPGDAPGGSAMITRNQY